MFTFFLVTRNVDKFDVSLLKAAAALFPGTRDFRTFMGSKARSLPDISTIKEIYRLDITPGTPLLDVNYSSSYSHYTFWDITCQARSFLYRQVMWIYALKPCSFHNYRTTETV